MSQSESIELLAGALSKAQGEFPAIKKTKTAKIPMKSGGSFSYTYADLGDIREAVTPTLTKYGLAVSQSPTIRGETPTLTTKLLHESGQWMSEEMFLHIEKNDAQGQGSAITYARRYAVSAMLGIVTEDDDDGARASNRDKQLAKTEAAVKKAETVQRTAPLTERQQQIKDGLEVLHPDERKSFGEWWVSAGYTKGVQNLKPDEADSVWAALFAMLNGNGEVEGQEPSQGNLDPSEAIVEAFGEVEPVPVSKPSRLTQATPNPDGPTKKQMDFIRKLCDDFGVDVYEKASNVLEAGVTSLSALSKAQAKKLIDSLIAERDASK